jgi:zinc transport system ATP-binding protein
LTLAIELQQVSFSYGGPPALKNIDLAVPEGEFLGVVGPNAGGKSTLIKILLGLLKPQNGQVRVLGRNPVASRRFVGYVPQYPSFRRDFPITVEQVVNTGCSGAGRICGDWWNRNRAVVRKSMDEAEVGVLANRRIETLSGGQLQRVLLARALASLPRILLLDEPTANIDMRVETDIFGLLRQLNRRMTIVVVSHDVAFVSKYVHRVACLNTTLMCHRTEDIDGQTIQDLYGADVRMVAHVH